MKIRWCVIGAGGIADRRMMPAICMDKGSELVALMDRNPENAEKLGKKYNVKYYTSCEEMLDENPCDCVYIGTPVYCHYEHAMCALKQGANVFIEKPVGLNKEEGEKLEKAFKKAGKLIYIGYMMKYHNLHKKAKSLIKEDKIGKVSVVRMQFSCWYPDIKNAWRQSKKTGGGGAIMDLGVHCIYLAEYVLNDRIKDVKALYGTNSFNYEVEDSGTIIFRTEKGVLGNIDVNFNIPDNASLSKMEMYGEKGYVICTGTLGQEEKGNLKYLYSPQGEYVAMQNRKVDKPVNFIGNNGNLYYKQMKDFIKVIKSGKPDYRNIEDAVHVQEVIDKIYKEK